MIDDTRTQGDKTSFNNMFEAIERIKNGYLVSTMYGRYAEAMYARPQIIFCTNREIFGYLKSLSRDRWYHMKITEDHKLIKLGWTDALCLIQLWVHYLQLNQVRKQTAICYSRIF